MRVFLTGATGFIGQPLTQALLRRGWEVTALVRQPGGRAAQALAAGGARLVPGDVVETDRSALAAAMRGHDLVFHNAGWFEVGLSGAHARARMRAINIGGTETVLGLAVELGVPRIVYTSSIIVTGDTGDALADESFVRRAPPATFYEQTKTEAHAIARRYQAQGAPLVIVSPGQVIGPGDHAPFGHYARLYVRGVFPGLSWAPDSVFTMVHVDDVAEAMALGAEHGRPGRTYFVAGGPITMREIMRVWRSMPGGLKPRGWLPRPVARLNGVLAAPLLRLLGQSAFLSPEVVDSSYGSLRYSSALAEQELGARFRSPEQAWRDTLTAERALIGRR
jgi:dihydroflavonol-4-reductase